MQTISLIFSSNCFLHFLFFPVCQYATRERIRRFSSNWQECIDFNIEMSGFLVTVATLADLGNTMNEPTLLICHSQGNDAIYPLRIVTILLSLNWKLLFQLPFVTLKGSNGIRNPKYLSQLVTTKGDIWAQSLNKTTNNSVFYQSRSSEISGKSSSVTSQRYGRYLYL